MMNIKRKVITFLVLLSGINCNAQIVFEKGYYIDNANQKIECLIKNIDWRNNPDKITYKLPESIVESHLTIKSFKEFGIYNVSKYKKFTVDIDKSSEDLNELSDTKAPIFNKEELFLKVLVDGNVSLYAYVDGSLSRFFYEKNGSIQQLIYKSYLTKDKNLGHNYWYKQQLWNDLRCDNISLANIEKIKYSKASLVNFFVKYNDCIKSEFVNFEEKVSRDLFNLTLRAGLNISTLDIQNNLLTSKVLDSKHKEKVGFRLGLEAEFILPINKNKWAVLVEPTFQYFKTKETKRTDYYKHNGIIEIDVDYKSIELPIGVRHYFFLENDSKMFLNLSLEVDFSINSKIDHILPNGTIANTFKIKALNNFVLGVGYKSKDKYSVELRYHTKRDILRDYIYWSADYSSFSFVLGYSIN